MAYQITVFSDNVCPWCYVGKRHLEQAVKNKGLENNVNVHWKPFFLNVNAPTDSNTPIYTHLMQKYGPQAGQRMAAALKQAGERAGIAFTDDRSVQNTVMSHRLVHLASKQGKQNEVIEGLFSRYFEHGAKLSDIDELESIAAAAGVQGARAYLESTEDVDAVFSEAAAGIKRYNISGVPYFIIRRDGNREKIELSGAQPAEEFEAAFEALA